ncbi:MAG TPA: tetratricopeptide repeat protein [Candidatus Acidoferrum sp.]|jgi:tetratricopeptide (TPR) repeat protein
MNKIGVILAASFLLPFCSLRAHAAQQAPADDKAAVAEASAAYDAKDWAKAAQLYAPMVKVHPEIARLWYRLGTSQQELGQLDQALQTLEQGLKAGVPPIFAEFAIGTIYAQKGDKEKAFEYLQKAMDSGYNKPEQLDSDEHLAALRSDPRFAKMRRQAEHNLKPCASTPENRQFDFWLGEWNVETTQGGVPAGQSRIELILGDCVVQENWQSDGNPYSGKSYNMYNTALKRWEQYWVDNSAGNIFFYGGLKDEVMDYWTDAIPQPTGLPLKRHLQFFKLGPDKVRQFSQGSTDDGKTWSPEYDFTYIRKK